MTLFGAALLIGPTVLFGAYVVMLGAARDPGPRGPEFRALSPDADRAPSGYVAYVTRSRGARTGPGPGCIWVVHASGAQAPRRLGCSGRRGVPDTIGGLSWTASGDLEVRGGPASATAHVLRVYGGRAAPGVIAESDRVKGRRDDGATVATKRPAEHVAQLVLTAPDGSTSSLVSVEGPGPYSFGEPQWSPDGRWVLLSDIHGRLLVADGRGKEIRQLVPAGRSRSLIEAPFLTWFQGSRL